MTRTTMESAFVVPPYNDPEWVEKMITATEFLVEATSYEALSLWQEWQSVLRVEQVGCGFSETIGELSGRPIAVSVFWHFFEGHLVGFYEATSQVVDTVQVEAWLKEKFPCMSRPWDGTRRRQTNAMNFGHCLHAIIPDEEWKAHPEWKARRDAINDFMNRRSRR